MGIRDLAVTLLLWIYFIFGFLSLFAPLYAYAALFPYSRERSFQRLNHLFFKGFFHLVRLLVPGHHWQVDEHAKQIRSAVIVCNHRSYLDPLILISLYARQKTIVKSRLFAFPIFGWLMSASGYIPSISTGRFADQMIRQIKSMHNFLGEGGNLFIFPEGTRSVNGEIGRLNQSAFKIARQCCAAIEVLFIQNTERLFHPGKFRFNTRGPNTIKVNSLGCLKADIWTGEISLTAINSRVQAMMQTFHDSGHDSVRPPNGNRPPSNNEDGSGHTP